MFAADDGIIETSMFISKPEGSIPKSRVPNLTSSPETMGSSGISTAERGIYTNKQ